MIFSNAGHQKPFLVRPGSSKLYELDTDGIMLGFSKEMSGTFASKFIQLHSADKIVLFTDGITEAIDRNGNDYGIDRLLDTIRKHTDQPGAMLLDSIVADVTSFTEGARRRDDETIMIIEIK
jgi:phosphoserine phosphatase RsbU/P